ncbi:DUF6069 family protein [Micromonospora globbae]|uniref:DUF6069 family protein n=1 Tax=Micromonospora globbae TaxID=1894969 RepID=A0ABZ1SA83_9ACTN|nr:DUF6069 family protein [Micromonospora globbae]
MTRILVRRSAVTAGAVVLAVAEYATVRWGAGIDLAARTGASTRAVSVTAVAVAAALAALAGWGLLALLERVTTRARALWTTIAVVVLLISLVGALGGVGAGAVATFVLLHLTVGVVLIVGLPGREVTR